MAETHTHADGVVGHFTFNPPTRIGLELVPDSKQFIIVEAKMYSSLGGGTKKVAFYDQAARTVACMATTIERVRKSVDEFESIGFYVMAPDSQIKQRLFAEQMTRESIVEKVRRRIEDYRRDKDDFLKLRTWFHDAFDPLVKRIDLDCWPWETAVDAIAAAKPAEGNVVKAFYSRCRKYNQRIVSDLPQET